MANESVAVMNRLEYFKARLEATITPVEVLKLLETHPESICVVDVRNGPAKLLGDRVPDALQIPQNVILLHTGRLPKDRILVLYCWDTWCSLAAEAAVPLLERGFDVREMYGGMRARKTLKFPREPVDSEALAGQHEPLAV